MIGKPFKCVASNAPAVSVRVSKSQRIRELEAMVEHLQAANRCLNLEAEQLRGLLLAR